MTKCDFCTQSTPYGKCSHSFQGAREHYCKKAIKRMIQAFKNENNKMKGGIDHE